MEDKDKINFFDDAGKVSNIVIVIIAITLILSQSFAINNSLGVSQAFSSVINYTSLYILLLVYFVSIKFNFGKKYFNYFNVFLIILYFIKALSSFLTLFQSLSLDSLLGFGIDLVFFLYLFHTMLRSTRVWKDYKISNSPFNELSNDFYFEFIFIASSILLAVDLIASTTFNGSIVCILDYLFLIFFGRYIYLYRDYLDEKKINSNNIGNFDEIKKEVNESVNDIKEDINEFIEENKIDEKVDKAKEEVVEVAKDTKKNVEKFIEENKIDEKVVKAKEEVVEVAKDTKKNVEKFIEENKIDEKVDKAKEEVVEVAKDTKKKVDHYIKDKKDNNTDKNISNKNNNVKKNNYVKKEYKENKNKKKNNIKKADGE